MNLFIEDFIQTLIVFMGLFRCYSYSATTADIFMSVSSRLEV